MLLTLTYFLRNPPFTLPPLLLLQLLNDDDTYDAALGVRQIDGLHRVAAPQCSPTHTKLLLHQRVHSWLQIFFQLVEDSVRCEKSHELELLLVLVLSGRSRRGVPTTSGRRSCSIRVDRQVLLYTYIRTYNYAYVQNPKIE